MTTKRNFLFITFFILLFSCNSSKASKKTKEKSKQTIKNLAGKAYYFAPNFDTINCEAVSECDCCNSSILFLDNTNFITITYCLADEHIYRGIYKIDHEKVHLRFSTLEIYKQYNLDKEIDTTGTITKDYFVTINKTEANEVTLTSLKCKGKVYFEVGEKEKNFGSLDTKITFDQYIKKLKNDGIWKILMN